MRKRLKPDMKMIFQRTLNGFTPVDEASDKLWSRTTPGDLIKVDATLPHDQRSMAQHRLYFAVLKHVFDNLPERYSLEIPNAERLRKRIFHEIGFTEEIITRHGVVHEARSIAHEKLGQSDFYSLVWEPTIRLIDKMAPGLGEAFNAEYRELIHE